VNPNAGASRPSLSPSTAPVDSNGPGMTRRRDGHRPAHAEGKAAHARPGRVPHRQARDSTGYSPTDSRRGRQGRPDYEAGLRNKCFVTAAHKHPDPEGGRIPGAGE